jgi:hypothetical protein
MPDRRHPDPAVLASDVLDRRDFLARVGAYRSRHGIPEIAWPLYAPVYAKYVNNYPPSLFTKYLPPTLADAARFLRDPKNRNWK